MDGALSITSCCGLFQNVGWSNGVREGLLLKQHIVYRVGVLTVRLLAVAICHLLDGRQRRPQRLADDAA